MPGSVAAAYNLAGQVALVTGGARGIGLSIATLLAEQGARIVLVDSNPEVTAVAAGFGRESFGLVVDVRDAAAVEAAVAEIVRRTGRVDILVNNVGVGVIAPAAELANDVWDLTMSVNLRATFLFSREVGRHMIGRGYGRIVSMASQAALVALDDHVAYGASKAGVIGMSKVLALEWGPKGITSNTISPTVINTPMGKMTWVGERGDAFRAKIPVGRFGEAEEIAHAVLYLVSKAAGMINGENLVIDGGYTIT
ncbi:MAG TPA: D-threitol dehydrogenase [Acidisoma sp.]|jgi:2-deoxy-D-gluconate 3-dehydrogenase|nr:D-threitol dehydrogenase [Acidisoma sp.]